MPKRSERTRFFLPLSLLVPGLALTVGLTVAPHPGFSAENQPAPGATSTDNPASGTTLPAPEPEHVRVPNQTPPTPATVGSDGAGTQSGPSASTSPTTQPAAQPVGQCPTDVTPITEVQLPGKDDDSALVGKKKISVCGVVTSSHPRNEGGMVNTLDGFTLQTPGTGGAWDPARTSSDAIFIYLGSGATSLPPVGSCVKATGKVAEYSGAKKSTSATQSLTQLTGVKLEVLPTPCAPVTPTSLSKVPNASELEALESMLVQPAGTWTITDNYQANSFGTLTLTPGTEPLRQATDVVSPGAEAVAYEAANAEKTVVLDDGSNANFLTNKVAKNHPYAYLTEKAPSRVGTHVTFAHPVLVDSRHGAFVLQPTSLVAGFPDRTPLSQTLSRPEAPKVPGDVRVATFNVLNYFVDLGADEKGCKAYTDRDGQPVTTKKCAGVRGAFTSEAFAAQQSKIVSAITKLGADVVALEEIENPTFPPIGKSDRDAALANLVAALNAHEGAQVWAFVPSPAKVPAKQDAIRTAFIHKVATVKPVGPSVILDDPAFTGVARQPLAQVFEPVVDSSKEGKKFTVIANHFKSKGSVPAGKEDGNVDSGDGQGNSNGLRVAQARALVAFANSDQFADLPVLLVGDFNSYSKEDPVRVILEAGFTHESANTGASYMYGGRVGSLDHVFANKAAHDLVAGVASWAVNAEESVAFEYSRKNYNVAALLDVKAPWRSSDHNPEIIGLNVVRDLFAPPAPGPQGPQGPEKPQTPQKPGTAPSVTPPAAPKAPSTSPAPSAKETPSSPLAHTGSAVLPIAIGAGCTLLAGVLLAVIRRGRKR